MISKDFRFAANQGLQLRLELFNITNRLNYENPAATLPNGTVGMPFTDARPARSATCSARSTARSAWARAVRRNSPCGSCSESAGSRVGGSRVRCPEPDVRTRGPRGPAEPADRINTAVTTV